MHLDKLVLSMTWYTSKLINNWAWYKHRYAFDIPTDYVLPVKGSLQGHPDSGEIWQTKVNSILESYNFTTTTHEPCLYRGTFKGELLLLCRQVDDMLIAGKNSDTIKLFVQEIASQLNVTHSDGPSTRFNGLDIEQTDQGIKISCSTYIKKLQIAHGWNDISPKLLEPISPSNVHELQSTKGPDINSEDRKVLKRLKKI
jgi:Reverse transcriptase (RNA-dependent DNA polymerase).